MMFTKILGIDFETANAIRSSACAVGLFAIEYPSGVVLDKKTLLIKPVPNYFDDFNVMIHGITPDMVSNAPDFSAILPAIESAIDEHTIVVAHNAAFDMGVIQDACTLFKLPYPSMQFLCTLVISRVLLPGLASYSLPELTALCGLDEFHHHEAAADAEACARLFLYLLDKFNFSTTEDILSRTSVLLGLFSSDSYSSCRRKKNASFLEHRKELKNLTAPIDSEHLCDNPFFGASCVFTGKLLSMSRADAENMVVERGGHIGDKINAETNYLICGYQDPRVLKGKAKSRKLLSAEKLASDGVDIQIIREEDFIKML